MTILRCVLALAGASLAFGQEIAFTSRVPLDSPVMISSFAESKVYGFDSVMLRNDSPEAVSAVQLVVTFRADDGEEIAEERRFPVELRAHETKRVIVDLGHVTGLRQKIKSGGESKALAVISVKLVEFENGQAWRTQGLIEGIPVQGVDLPLPPLRKK